MSCWYSLVSFRRVLSDRYPCARGSVIFQVFFTTFCNGQISHQVKKGKVMICPYLFCHVFGKTAGNNDDVFRQVFSHHFVLAKLATSSIRVKCCCTVYILHSTLHLVAPGLKPQAHGKGQGIKGISLKPFSLMKAPLPVRVADAQLFWDIPV